MGDPLIGILTDFGHQDPFVGIMKGVIAGINPEARTADLGHEIPPGDVQQASLHLWQAVPYFPAGTIFLVVVDPGVGTARKAIIARAGDRFFIGPDNGVFTFIWEQGARAWELNDQGYQLASASATFHGRDIFAPAAAYCSLGIPPEDFGPIVPRTYQLPPPNLQLHPRRRLDGEILYADRFGNLLTSLGLFSWLEPGSKKARFSPWLPSDRFEELDIDLEHASIRLPGGRTLGIAHTFGEIKSADCAGVIGSSGLLELAAKGRPASEILKLDRGTTVTLIWP